MSYVLVTLMLGLLVLIHELGHLAAAGWAGIPVERFSAGFGPRVIGFHKGGTDYRLSLIPLGGYVMLRLEDEAGWSSLPLFKRLVFCLGGPAANLCAALVGIVLWKTTSHDMSLSSVLVEPVLALLSMIQQIVSGIPVLFQHPDKLSGIVGIVAAGGRSAGADLGRLTDFSILLSVNLAVFNLLPIPPLDGGRIFLSLLEKIHGPMRRLEMPLSVAGWLMVASLMLYATVLDIRHLV